MCEACVEARKDAEISRLRRNVADERRAKETQLQSTDILQKTISDLRLQLRKYRQQEHQAIEFKSPKVSLFLKKIPAEIRNKIYKLLLVNPQLGQKNWIGENTKYGARFQYRLHPAILRTCHTIHGEALSILYGSNKFILVCHRKKAAHNFSYLPQSPLTRYMDQSEYEGHGKFFDFDQIPFINMIRRWRVITGHPCTHMVASKGFVQFCRTISRVPPMNLEVLVLLKMTTSSLQANQQKESLRHMESIEKAMGVLRNVQRLAVRPAQRTDLPGCIASRHNPWYPDEPQIYYEVQSRCKRLVTGNSPVEKVFEMNSRLLAYAQTFERSEQFKAQMAPNYDSLSAVYIDSQNPTLPTRNPYTEAGMDNLEMLLYQAETASACQESTRFKITRNRALEHLEPQYQRIEEGCAALTTFVEKQKTKYALLDMNFLEYSEECGEAPYEESLSLLETLAKEFERDMSPQVKYLVRKNPTRYHMQYENLPRERWLRQMSLVLQEGNVDCHHFMTCFKLVADDMIAQYLNILEARKALFHCDVVGDTGCTIEIDLDVNASPIDWTTDPSMFEESEDDDIDE